MSDDDDVKSLKTNADAMYKDGKVEEAITLYTKAINASTRNDPGVDVLKTLHSNRSAAYAQMKNFSSSLLDAEKCIELDSTWVKGFIRKGDALYSLRRLTDALKSYKSGLEISATDSVLKGKVEQIERAIYQASHPTPPPPPSSSAANKINSPMLQKVQGYLRFGFILLAIGYLIPFVGKAFNGMCYRVFLINAIGSFLISLYLKHGFPSINQEYFQSLILDQPTSAYLFMSTLLLSQKPYMLPLFPIILVESFPMIKGQDLSILNNPALASQLATIQQQMPALMGRSDWNNLSTTNKWNVAENKVRSMAATCEIWQGLFFLIELIFPSRSMLGTVMWWQYLQMRCMTSIPSGASSPIMQAFSELDRQISTLLAHRYCPQAVRKGYDLIRQQARQRCQLPQAGSQPTGMMGALKSMIPSSCTIS